MDLFLVMHLKSEIGKGKKVSAFPIFQERPSLKKNSFLRSKRWILK